LDSFVVLFTEDSRGNDGKIEEVGEWLAKQWSSDLEKPGGDLVQACGRRTECVEKSSHTDIGFEWGKEVVCLRGGGV